MLLVGMACLLKRVAVVVLVLVYVFCCAVLTGSLQLQNLFSLHHRA